MATGLTGSTRAPNARINCDFSAAASSGRDRNASQPSAFATIATETPVEPAVPSVTTPPFLNVPFAIASVTILNATRSLTEPPGLANSHLIKTSHPVISLSDATRIIGVLPMVSSTEKATGGGRAFCTRFPRGVLSRKNKKGFPGAPAVRGTKRSSRSFSSPSSRRYRATSAPPASAPTSAEAVRVRKKRGRWSRGQRRDDQTSRFPKRAPRRSSAAAVG